MPYKDPSDPRAKAVRLKHYYANKQPYLDRAKAAKQEMARYLEDLKTSKPCMDCGLRYPHYVMDFDHREDEIKLNNVSTLIFVIGASRKTIDAEIAKCDLVCANCHRIRTHDRRAA